MRNPFYTSPPYKMATVWIHRTGVCDMIVPHKNINNARQFGEMILRNNTKDDSEIYPPEYPDEVGATANLQVTVQGPDFFHKGWSRDGNPPDSWNHRGTVFLKPLDAFCVSLTNGEPVGFIPYESEGLWKKETRTKEDLDKELEEYMLDDSEYTYDYKYTYDYIYNTKSDNCRCVGDCLCDYEDEYRKHLPPCHCRYCD